MEIRIPWIRRKVKCVDCGMLSFHRNTNDYREVYRPQRVQALAEGIMCLDLDDDVTLACYRNVDDLEAKVERTYTTRPQFWTDLGVITQERRCRKFIEYLPGRLPSHLVENQRIKLNWRIRIATLAATIVIAVWAGLALLLD